MGSLIAPAADAGAEARARKLQQESLALTRQQTEQLAQQRTEAEAGNAARRRQLKAQRLARRGGFDLLSFAGATGVPEKTNLGAGGIRG